MQRIRSQSEFRDKERLQDANYKREKRKRSDFRDSEQFKYTDAKRTKRCDPILKQNEQIKNTQFRKNKRTDPQVRQNEQLRDTKARKDKRQDSNIRQNEQLRDTKARKDKRQDSNVRQNEQLRDSDAKRAKRDNPILKQNEQIKNTQFRKHKRTDPQVRQNEQLRDTNSRRRSRIKPSSEEMAINIFQKKIMEGPTFVCVSCHRLLYRSSVCILNRERFVKMDPDVLSSCIVSVLSPDGKEYICNACQTAMSKGNMPNISVGNGLDLDDVPTELADLNSLEALFISRGKQKSVHGCVVNIPIEPEQNLSVLPRVPSPDSLITVKLKRKIQYRGHVFLQNIRPRKIENALHILKNVMNNPLYSNVTLNQNWATEAQQNDANLWNRLTNQYSDDNDDNVDDSEVEEEDERSRLSGLPFSSCIQPKDISTDTNLILNYAPGENKRPKSFHIDEHSEELSFPHLFPSGKFGFSMPRSQKVSMKKYFQTRILNNDTRFARNIEYIFHAQYRCEAKEIQDSLSISLRKGKQMELTAGEISVIQTFFPIFSEMSQME